MPVEPVDNSKLRAGNDHDGGPDHDDDHRHRRGDRGATEVTGPPQSAALPRTGTSTSTFLLLAGVAFTLGGVAIRFAPPETPGR